MNILDKIPFKDNLRRCQKIGVRLIKRMNGKCLIADPTGSGKTLLSLSWFAANPDLRPVLIIVNSTAKLKWAKEIRSWMPKENVQVISGKKNIEITGSMVVINWDIIHYSEKVKNEGYPEHTNKEFKKIIKAREDLANVKWRGIVGDEIHKISNNKAGRTKAFKRIVKFSPHLESILTLSATPIENKPINFFNILQIIDRENFNDWFAFTKRYCDRKHNGFGWDYSGASNTKELHQKVKKIMIRRDVEEILPELPPENRIIVPLEIDNRKEYDQAKNDYINWLRENRKDVKKAKRALTLTKITQLKKLAVKGTIKQAIKWLENYLEDWNKIVVGCIHREINDKIFEHFKNISVQIIGGMGEKKKFEANEKFLNDDRIKLASCNIDSAGESIDLQSAPSTCTLELADKPSKHEQFEGRISRIGQKSNIINHFYLVGVDTVMEDIAELINSKKKIIDAIVDGKFNEDEDFIDIINSKLEEDYGI